LSEDENAKKKKFRPKKLKKGKALDFFSIFYQKIFFLLFNFLRLEMIEGNKKRLQLMFVAQFVH